MNPFKKPQVTPYLMAVICLGLVTCALTQDLVFQNAPPATAIGFAIITSMQFGIPVFLGVLLCTGKRWTIMVGIVYGTVGLALDLATIVQSVTGETDPVGFVFLTLASGILNFLLILLGGRGLFTQTLQ